LAVTSRRPAARRRAIGDREFTRALVLVVTRLKEGRPAGAIIALAAGVGGALAGGALRAAVSDR
jgi:hypothetical protein